MLDAEFTPAERDLIRREFMMRLSSARSLHDGVFLRRWATGPRKFDTPFACIAWMAAGLFNIAWHRHTSERRTLFERVSLKEALRHSNPRAC